MSDRCAFRRLASPLPLPFRISMFGNPLHSGTSVCRGCSDVRVRDDEIRRHLLGRVLRMDGLAALEHRDERGDLADSGVGAFDVADAK